MAISCPSPTVQSKVAGKCFCAGLKAVSNPQWFVYLVVFFAVLLQGTASNIVVGTFTFGIGVIA